MKREPKSSKALSIVRLVMASMSVGVTVGAGAARAEDTPSAPKRWEECYGIAKAHQNDCGSSDGRHGCGGASTLDGDPTEWMWVPKGYCSKIVGGVTGKVVRAKKLKVAACTNSSKTNARRR